MQQRNAFTTLLALVVGLSPSAAATQTYTITNLGTLCPSSQDCSAPDISSTAFDVNNCGSAT